MVGDFCCGGGDEMGWKGKVGGPFFADLDGRRCAEGAARTFFLETAPAIER